MYKQELSDQVRAELERLSRGNTDQQKRYTQALEAISRVLQIPNVRNNSKHSVNQYKAVDVGGQYRIFYEIDNPNERVFFVWMNNEDSKHDSSRTNLPGECYTVFKSLLEAGKLPQIPLYTAPAVLSYEVQGDWLNDEFLYFSLKTTAIHAYGNAYLHLNEDDYLNKQFGRSFIIGNIQGKEQLVLLNKILEDARNKKIPLIYFPLSEGDRELFLSRGFVLSQENIEDGILIYTP